MGSARLDNIFVLALPIEFQTVIFIVRVLALPLALVTPLAELLVQALPFEVQTVIFIVHVLVLPLVLVTPLTKILVQALPVEFHVLVLSQRDGGLPKRWWCDAI